MKYRFFKGAYSTRQKEKKKTEDDGEEDAGDDDGVDSCANQLLQLMQMQLQFERQRREVHAERNRRLLGKLRDSRASEEHNLALVCSYSYSVIMFVKSLRGLTNLALLILQTDRLKMIEKEAEELKAQLEHNKKEAHQAEEQYKEAMHHWQAKVWFS